ncbi:MAG: patatin-like phospholipase family protein [Candidatus Melainabacteria bacterium]|nr:patatin-like phospholipase family protein [Candidatus Melainabacteria bacterium]
MGFSKSVSKTAMLLALASSMATSAYGKEEIEIPVQGASPDPQRGAINRDSAALSPTATMSETGKDNFTETRPHLVLALSGGACKAVAQIGALRSLEKNHIKVDGIVGTSMGATIGALYCAGLSVDEIEALFMDATIQDAMLKGATLSILTRPLKPLLYLFKGRPYAGITDGKGYRKLLQEKLPKTFEELRIPFAAVVTNLTDGQTEVLAHGDLPSAVLASNCVPTIYRPVIINNKLYVDGGLKANLPSHIAQSMGANVVVAVLVDTAVTSVPNRRFKSKDNMIMRVMNIMLASSDKMQAGTSDILIYPDVDFVPSLTKDTSIIKRGIDAGELAADSVIKKIATEILALSKKRETSSESAEKTGQTDVEIISR